jgi:prepilin-type N-terminal cleavage/methylation domain-containing protein
MNHVDKRRGFTLIELMLAMSFISLLLIAITLTILQISSIYNRGITLKEVNAAGRTLGSELQRSIAETDPFSIESGAGSRYILQGDWGGRLCLGQYSYIWNFGKALVANDSSRLNLYADAANTPVHFAKVLDPDASYCSQVAKKVDPATSVELLDVGDHDLAIHSFVISSAATANDSKTRQRLYTIDFVIGTNDQVALAYDTSSGEASCKPPSAPGADPSYCSVNKFSIVARAGNTVQ